jgi:hypothetical protein
MRKATPIEDRFWSKVNKTDSCWNWTSSIVGNGYGGLFSGTKKQRKSLRAHRFSYELHNGVIPEGLFVLHKCDNRLCVNPEHLFLGDSTDNMRDCAAKGRVITIGQSRKTNCIRGHEFNQQNTYFKANGHRQCRICSNLTRAINRKQGDDLGFYRC